MDYRDSLSMFGSLFPHGTQIDEVRNLISFTVEDDDNVEVEHVLPFTWGVCSCCHGKGSYVNPSIDAHGITQEEWSEWDEDEREGYMSGRYDVTCEQCRGRRVEPVPTEPDQGSSVEHKIAWETWCSWGADESAYRREREAEIKMGY